MGVGSESSGGVGEAAGEIAPEHSAGHVEEHLRKTVGGKLGDVAKDDGEYQRGKQRLDDEPQRTKDRLLITRDKVAPHEQADQVAVMPDVAQLQIPPLLARGDDQVPLFLF